MRKTGVSEEHIVRAEWIPSISVHEEPLPARHDVQLVARLRLLVVHSTWRIDLHCQRPVLERNRRALSTRTEKLPLNLPDGDASTCPARDVSTGSTHGGQEYPVWSLRFKDLRRRHRGSCPASG